MVGGVCVIRRLFPIAIDVIYKFVETFYSNHEVLRYLIGLPYFPCHVVHLARHVSAPDGPVDTGGALKDLGRYMGHH